MVDKIPGDDFVSPQDRVLYRAEYEKAAQLFAQSLDAYQKADFPEKQATLKDVMNKALTIMNETAQKCLRGYAIAKNNQLQTDYDTFLKSGSPENIEKLEKDIKSITHNHSA